MQIFWKKLNMAMLQLSHDRYVGCVTKYFDRNRKYPMILDKIPSY
jgi:hypothetical protein